MRRAFKESHADQIVAVRLVQNSSSPLLIQSTTDTLRHRSLCTSYLADVEMLHAIFSYQRGMLPLQPSPDSDVIYVDQVFMGRYTARGKNVGLPPCPRHDAGGEDVLRRRAKHFLKLGYSPGIRAYITQDFTQAGDPLNGAVQGTVFSLRIIEAMPPAYKAAEYIVQGGSGVAQPPDAFGN